MIIAFRAPSPLAGLTELPTRLKIGKWGRNVTGKGTGFTVNERTAAVMPRVQQALSFDKVALDFEHNTVPTEDENGKQIPPKEPQKIAAKGVPLVIAGEGLFLDQLEWTPEGRDHALGGHYPDLSPAVKMNDAGEVIFVHSAGLCRQGSVMDLSFFSAALNAGQLATFSAASHSTQKPMDYKKILLLLLGQPETASDTDIETGAKAFAAKVDKVGDVTQFSATLKKSEDTITALVARLDAQERDHITFQAIAAGKVIPHSATTIALADFKKIVAELPADVVPMAQRTVEGVKSFSASTTHSAIDTAGEEAVRNRLGLSKETWAKHNPAK